MRRAARGAIAGAVLLLGTGCASARYVLLEPGGGAIAIPRDSADNRAKAAELMARRCPGGYDILREEEVVTGSEITNESSTEVDKTFAETRTTQRLSTRTRTEWRITFRCTDRR